MKSKNYQHTMYACFIGYIVQAIVNNFLPLIFLTLQNQYNIPLNQITLLITFNFGIQLTIDLISAFFVDKIGYRKCMLIAHICSAIGFILLTVLPEILPPFIGILISVMLYAVGGGLLEVLVSPIMESCPTQNKEKAMSLLHSFYCWGQVGVVLLSTIFFNLFGISNWKILACIWAIIPIVNAINFIKVPIAPLVPEDEKEMTLSELLKSKVFWLLMLMMCCAGASELTVSQWVSFFAEEGLHISKTYGDLSGTMLFAVLMGTSRAFYGKYGDKINLDKFMNGSTILCIFSYIIISLVPNPILNLAGCAICGLSVGIMWPGTFSKASSSLRGGGTVMFSLLALAGDVGCATAPTLAGMIANVSNMKTGILVAVIFPIMMIVGIQILKKNSLNNK